MHSFAITRGPAVIRPTREEMFSSAARSTEAPPRRPRPRSRSASPASLTLARSSVEVRALTWPLPSATRAAGRCPQGRLKKKIWPRAKDATTCAPAWAPTKAAAVEVDAEAGAGDEARAERVEKEPGSPTFKKQWARRRPAGASTWWPGRGGRAIIWEPAARPGIRCSDTS